MSIILLYRNLPNCQISDKIIVATVAYSNTNVKKNNSITSKPDIKKDDVSNENLNLTLYATKYATKYATLDKSHYEVKKSRVVGVIIHKN